tara:strand:- start:187 stop:804 length:618 start_codon:yes stop_codon:yes gene_type:complete
MKKFKKNKYAVIRSVLNEQAADIIRQTFYIKAQVLRTHRERRHISPYNNDFGILGDDQCTPETFCCYGDPLSDSLLTFVKPFLEKEYGGPLIETYSYMRIYLKGTVLEKHTDRLSCEVSATLCVEDNSWPIFLETETGKKVKVDLHKGDILIYKGCDLNHWRDASPFDTYAQIFLHFNSAKTKTRKYDGRPHLGLPVSHKGSLGL